MNAENFEERLLQELKRHVSDRSQAAAPEQGRRARQGRRAPWRLASGGIGVAVAMAAAVLVANISPATSPDAKSPTATAAPTSAATGAPFHLQNAAFAIDAEPSGAVDITILRGSDKPDVGALRDALAEAGVNARVVTNVPTCEQLAHSPGAPSPVGSAQTQDVTDALDHPFFTKSGDLVYSVDASAHVHDTTLWIMFSSTLSTIFVERTTDTGPQPNCMTAATGNE